MNSTTIKPGQRLRVVHMIPECVRVGDILEAGPICQCSNQLWVSSEGGTTTISMRWIEDGSIVLIGETEAV
jgi:hypothetical protein